MDNASSRSTSTRIQVKDQHKEAFKAYLEKQECTVRDNSQKYRLVEIPDSVTEPSETKRRHPKVKIKSVIPTDNEKSFPVKINKVAILPLSTEVKHMSHIKVQNLTNPLRVDTKVINSKSQRSRSIYTAYQNEVFDKVRNTTFLRYSLNAPDSHNGLVICLAETWKHNFLPNRNRGKEFLKSEFVQNSCLKDSYALPEKNKNQTSRSLQVEKLLENSNIPEKLTEKILVYIQNMDQITDTGYLFSTTPENREENCETIRKNEGNVRSQPQTGGGARVVSRPGLGGGGGRDPAPPGGPEDGAAAAPENADDGEFENEFVNGNAAGSSGGSGNGDGNDSPDDDDSDEDDSNIEEQDQFWDYVTDAEMLINSVQQEISVLYQQLSHLEGIIGNSEILAFLRAVVLELESVASSVQLHILDLECCEIDSDIFNELKNFMQEMCALTEERLITIILQVLDLENLTDEYGAQEGEFRNALSQIRGSISRINVDILSFIELHSTNNF